MKFSSLGQNKRDMQTAIMILDSIIIFTRTQGVCDRIYFLNFHAVFSK